MERDLSFDGRGFLSLKKASKNAGIFGRSSICGIISVVFLAPEVFARRGYIDLDEVKRFPLPLKLKIVIPWYAVMIVFFALACCWYTMGWYAR